MSSAPTDCRVPDPTDAKADGNFGNHRAGYGDRLDRITATARKGWTLAAGEGLALVQEIDRLRGELELVSSEAADAYHAIDRRDEELAQQSITLSAEHQRAERILAALREQLRDTHTKVFHLEEKLTWVERERDQLTSMPAERILAALREPSEQVLLAAVEAVPYGASYAALTRCIPAAVAAAEREASA